MDRSPASGPPVALPDLLAAVAPARPAQAAAGAALRALRSCLPYLSADGSLAHGELTIPEMAWLTTQAGCNAGRGYRPQTLFNAEQAYKYPTPGVVAAYSRVAELAASRPGWVERALESLPRGPEGGGWRQGRTGAASMAGEA